MPNFMLIADPADPFAVSYITSGSSAVDSTSYDFTASGFGAVAGSRIMIVGISARSGSAITAPTVTIGGVSATNIVQTSGDDDYAGLWWAAVPTDANLHVVVTFGVTCSRVGYGVYRMTGKANGTAFDTAANASAPTNAESQVDTPAGGAVILHGMNDSADTVLTGVTQVYDAAVEGGQQNVGGLATGVAATTNFSSFSATWAAASAVAVASFGP